MPKEIYLYDSIYSWTAENFNKELSNSPEEVNIYVLTDGGRTNAGSAMITHLSQYKGKRNMFIDGDTSSYGAFFVLYGDYVEMSEMAELMFHKASYGRYYEPTQAEAENLNRDNERFKAKMQERLGDKGAELIAKIFDTEKREDVYVTAEEALKIGLIDKVVKVSPERLKTAQLESAKQMIRWNDKSMENNTSLTNNNDNTMTQEEIDKKVKEAYDKGKAEGFEEGKSAELERVAAWNVFADIAPEKVAEGIASGKSMSRAEELTLMRQANTVAKEASLQNGSQGPVDTPKDENEDAGEQETAETKAKKEAVSFFGKVIEKRKETK